MASIRQRGDSWLAQVRIKRGGAIVFSEGRSFPTEALARSWARRLEDKISREGIPSRARASMTVGALIERHLQYQQTLRPLGRSAVQNHQYMASMFGHIPLDHLTAKHIIDFAARRRTNDGVSPATILANLSALSSAMHAGRHLHGIEVDTAELDAALRRLKDSGVTARSRQVDRLITLEEEAALLAEFERADQHPQATIPMAAIFRIALALPRRASELMRMRWEDIDPKRRTIIIRDVKHPVHKLGNDQVVPLLGNAWDLLQALPRTDVRVLPHNVESVLTAFERARNRLADAGMPGIRDLRFHDLRHAGITRLFQAGLPIQEVAIVSGHTNWVQLRRYTHIRPEDLHRHFT